MNEIKVLRKTENLIKRGKWAEAIQLIDKLLPYTTCARKCSNWKARCYIELQEYGHAQNIYKNYFPYAMVDEQDIIALRNLAELHSHLENEIKAKKYDFSYNLFTQNGVDRAEYLKKKFYDSRILYKTFYDSNEPTKDNLEAIIIDNLETIRMAEAAVYYALMKRRGMSVSKLIEDEFKEFSQVNEFSDELFEQDENKYCVLSGSTDFENILRDQCLAKALSMLGKEVIGIPPCIDVVGGMRNAVLDLNKNNSTNRPIVLFGDSGILAELNEDVEVSKLVQMNFRHFEKNPISVKDCVLVAPYLRSISYIWGVDIAKVWKRRPSVDFSIIIPVKNSIEYLKETIRTCLEQDYRGAYEVLISDNTQMECEVQNIVRDISDSRVRYIRTPFSLSLTKSFEFAYLNSCGKYLLSIGADDGLLKNALSTIFLLMEKYPGNNVLAWSRADYIWPDFICGENQNRLTYQPMDFTREIVREIEPESLIRKFAMREISYLFLPSMYLRTCVKREYVDKILDVTGKFQDGDSQDVYTGMLSLFLEKKMTYADYPFVISGGTMGSVGYTCAQSIQSIEEMGNRFRNGFAHYRYTNYYSAAFRSLETHFIPYETILLIYREFIKINHYFRNFNDYRNKFDMLKTLCQVHEALPDKHCDRAFLLNQLRRMAKVSGESTFCKYQKSTKIIAFRLNAKHLLRKSIGNQKIWAMLRTVFHALAKVYSVVFSKSNIQGSSAKGPLVDVACGEYGLSGIRGAAECLFQELDRMNYKIDFASNEDHNILA